MKKPYLLIAGYFYYPESGTGDWIACFETFEEAKNKVIKQNKDIYIDNNLYDWYEIIDLREWTDK